MLRRIESVECIIHPYIHDIISFIHLFMFMSCHVMFCSCSAVCCLSVERLRSTAQHSMKYNISFTRVKSQESYAAPKEFVRRLLYGEAVKVTVTVKGQAQCFPVAGCMLQG